MIKFLYQKGLKPILFKFHPDVVHEVFVDLGERMQTNFFFKKFLQGVYGAPLGTKTITVDGVEYSGPVLLAAGFDYNGRLGPALWNIGFAGEEVGSVTARKCAGNPPPNTTRLIQSKSIQVFKGLKNDGVDSVIERLKSLNTPKNFVTGVSIARTNDQQSSDVNEGIEDYFYSFKRLNEEEVGDYYTINISCPNAFGGEDFARPELLEKLLMRLKEIECKRPVYIKMPINKPWSEFKLLLDVIHGLGFQGVVIGNLNKNYEEVDFKEELPPGEFRGGLSGRPCQKRSNELIRKTKEYCPDLTIIGCGGVLEVKDAMEKMQLGASLVQLISGMIFNGPHLIGEINKSFYEDNRHK
ncbi:MAG: hypothetical protein CME64_08675 [Halobacteriovoraceae bacterium]|nr:hypothetical protein [Halobacteriovoraceae bacterium]